MILGRKKIRKKSLSLSKHSIFVSKEACSWNQTKDSTKELENSKEKMKSDDYNEKRKETIIFIIILGKCCVHWNWSCQHNACVAKKLCIDRIWCDYIYFEAYTIQILQGIYWYFRNIVVICENKWILLWLKWFFLCWLNGKLLNLAWPH